MTAQAEKPTQLLINTPDGKVAVVALEAGKYELGRDESNALAFPGVQGGVQGGRETNVNNR